MADAPDRDQQTEAPTEKRRRDAVEKGDVLQSRELGKSLSKVLVLGAVAAWLLSSRSGELVTLGRQDIVPALGELGRTFIVAVLVMALALAAIAAIDIPAQIFQRGARLRMSKQEV